MALRALGAPEWDSTPEEQAEAVTVMMERMAPPNADRIIWSFLWDPLAIAPYDTMGLLDDGPTSAALDAWDAVRD